MIFLNLLVWLVAGVVMFAGCYWAFYRAGMWLVDDEAGYHLVVGAVAGGLSLLCLFVVLIGIVWLLSWRRVRKAEGGSGGERW